MMRPLTSSIQMIEMASIRLGSVQRWSNWRIFSMVRIAFDFPWPVLSATPNALSMAVSFRCGLRLLSSRKLAQPIVRTIPQAQVVGLPPSKGDGRLRASAPARLRQRAAYSSVGTDQENGAVPDHLVSATRDVSVWASHSEAHFSSRFVLCLVPARAIDWQASVSFAF